MENAKQNHNIAFSGLTDYIYMEAIVKSPNFWMKLQDKMFTALNPSSIYVDQAIMAVPVIHDLWARDYLCSDEENKKWLDERWFSKEYYLEIMALNHLEYMNSKELSMMHNPVEAES